MRRHARRGASRRSSTHCSNVASTPRRRAFEAWFVNAAMGEEEFAVIADALPHAARAAKEARK